MATIDAIYDVSRSTSRSGCRKWAKQDFYKTNRDFLAIYVEQERLIGISCISEVKRIG